MSWDILKGKTQNFEIFYLVNKFRFVFYVTIYHPDIRNDAVLNIINHAKNQRNIQY